VFATIRFAVKQTKETANGTVFAYLGLTVIHGYSCAQV
jgi:hypothetical protein